MPAFSAHTDPRRPLREALRALSKRAAEGDGQDGSFEQSMSDVVHLVLKDKVPELLDYELGFQLVDRDSDDNKAIGVTIFKVGPHFLFQPAFFIKGKLKGTELLYVKDLDRFLPLSDGWVQHLIDKHPAPVGRRVDRDLGRLGTSAPDLRQITRPPTKWAAAADADADADLRAGRETFERAVLPRWARAVTADPLAGHYGLPAFLKEAGRPGVAALLSLVDRCPRLAYDLARYHGAGLVAACKEAAARPGPARPRVAFAAGPLVDGGKAAGDGDANDELREVTLDLASEDPTLFAPEWEMPRSHTDRFRVEDERPDRRVSTAYNLQVEQHLTNPTETGLYDVLVRPLAYEKCLVIMAPRVTAGRIHPCTMVRLSDRTTLNVDPGRIWVGKAYGKDEYRAFREGLPEARTLAVRAEPGPSGAGDARAYRVLLGRDGDATAPFRATADAGAADGGHFYRVRFRTHRDLAQPLGGLASPASAGAYDPVSDAGAIAVGTHRGGRLFSAGGVTYAPADTRVLAVTEPGWGDDAAAIVLGDPVDIHLDLAGKTLPLSVQLDKQSGTYRVDGAPFRGVAAALRHLVFDHGLREAAAREALGKAAAAARARDPVVRLRVKYADPYLSRDVAAPGIPEPATTAEHTLTRAVPGLPAQFRLLPVDSVRPRDDADQVYDLRNMPPPPWMLGAVEEAAGTGSREVFDTSMIAAMLSTTQGDLQVDRHIGPLMQGLDALGRILMALYWHPKDFADRYGKEDLAELEDMLRNCFTNLGKLVLNLKQQAVEDPLDADRELDLENAADQ